VRNRKMNEQKKIRENNNRKIRENEGRVKR
jgi:hypothetical protein